MTMTREQEIRERLREPIGLDLSDAAVGALADELGVLHHRAESTREAVKSVIQRVEALERASGAPAATSSPPVTDAVTELIAAAEAVIARLDAGPSATGTMPWGRLRSALNLAKGAAPVPAPPSAVDAVVEAARALIVADHKTEGSAPDAAWDALANALAAYDAAPREPALDAKDVEIARLRSQIARLKETQRRLYDGEHVRLLEEAQAETARLRAALEPFAKAAGIKLCGEWRDDERFSQTDVGSYLTFGDLRRAAAALDGVPRVADILAAELKWPTTEERAAAEPKEDTR
ncbi:hypothetical protein ACTZWW_04450 [Salinarimonas sp. NSM]|uniref:hypothetical protein n=1 Tax=Salinarimonas sp. NSM TaxID=3458003 RepID=UPI004036CF69